jgi:hypothetical protein
MLYIVDVHCHIDRPGRDAYAAFVRPFDDEPETYEPEEPTNTLAHLPPVENNVAYYRGTFASLGDAVAAVREYFPQASIDLEEVDSRIGRGFAP